MERWNDLLTAAEDTYGIVTRDELLAGGVSARHIVRWLDQGRIVHMGHGVYRLGGIRSCFEAEVLAAIKVFGPQTWASHGTTVRLVRLRVGSRESRIELTRPVALSAQRSIARVHRSTLLPAHHLTVVRGVPSVIAARGLFEIARTTGDLALRRVIDRALMDGVCTMGQLYGVLYDLGGRGRPGTRRTRRTLEALGRGYVPPESELEIVGRALLDGLGIEWQVEISDERGYIRRVDGLHRASRTVVELDGAQHRREPQRSLDQEGDRRLGRLGFSVVRLAWDAVTAGGDAARADLAARLQGAAA